MHRNSLLLGIVTTGDVCSVAVGTEQETLAEITADLPYGQAGKIMGFLEELLKKANISWEDLSGIAVDRGPGSFTGIRVGLSLAQGLSLAGGIPLFGLTGFEIYRSIVGVKEDLLVLIDTRRGDCFASFFEQGKKVSAFSKIMTYADVEAFSSSKFWSMIPAVLKRRLGS